MEMNEAMERATASANPLSPDELATRLAAAHSGNSQRQATAARGVSLLNEGLAILASLGHQYDIVDRQPRPVLAFPKAIYRRTPRGGVEDRTVHSQAELDEALSGEAGWSEAPSGEPKARPASRGEDAASREPKANDPPKERGPSPDELARQASSGVTADSQKGEKDVPKEDLLSQDAKRDLPKKDEETKRSDLPEEFAKRDAGTSPVKPDSASGVTPTPSTAPDKPRMAAPTSPRPPAGAAGPGSAASPTKVSTQAAEPKERGKK